MIFSDGDLTMSGNDIYRQVCVSFYLDSVIVTNIPAAYNLLYDSTTNDVWHFDRLVDIGRDTGGIECYFINEFVMDDGSAGPAGACNAGGIVLEGHSSVLVLAHEIGHAFGLKDIYVSNAESESNLPPNSEINVRGLKMRENFSGHDWNGGCRGHGDGGERYYATGTRLEDVIRRLLMYGVEQDQLSTGQDIVHGSVHGVWYIGSENAKEWNCGDAPVGFFSNLWKKEFPAHN